MMNNKNTNNWIKVNLEELCEDITVGHVGSMANEYVESGIPFLRSLNVKPFRIIKEDLKYISSGFHEKLKKSSLHNGDIVIVRTGEPGSCAIISHDFNNSNCSDLVILRPKSSVSSRFLMYYINSITHSHIQSHLVGAVQQHFNVGSARKISIYLPPLPTQKAIAHILGTLDDKIELNRRMNETLESIARAIFTSWFINFDPVRAKAEGRQPEGMDAATAALFPSEFEEVEGQEIPKGWAYQEIRERTSSIQYGLTRSASSEIIGPKFLRITDIVGGIINWADVPFVDISSEEYERYTLKTGDIVIARTGASTGENAYIYFPPKAVFASYLVRLQFDNIGYSRIISLFLRDSQYKEFIQGVIGGSAQPNASAQALSSFKCVFPSENIAEAFFKIIKPFDDKIASLQKENLILGSLRDTLLPKLLSGELPITNPEQFTGVS